MDMVVSPGPALELEGQRAEHVFLTVNTETELRDVCRMSSEDRVRLNVTEVLLTEKQSNAGQCVHVMFLWKLTRTCPGGPVD